MSDVLTADEFERRFLVSDLSIIKGAEFETIQQAYVWAAEGYAIRVRVITRVDENRSQDRAFLTLKGPRYDFHRYEAEIGIDPAHGNAIVAISPTVITKRRYGLISERNTWVVDVFEHENEGLVIAEFEASESAVNLLKVPWWAGKEVTADLRYSNENLAVTPWTTWADA